MYSFTVYSVLYLSSNDNARHWSMAPGRSHLAMHQQASHTCGACQGPVGDRTDTACLNRADLTVSVAQPQASSALNVLQKLFPELGLDLSNRHLAREAACCVHSIPPALAKSKVQSFGAEHELAIILGLSLKRLCASSPASVRMPVFRLALLSCCP
jgi:hypothetical protein